ncbi:MAG: DUF2281 domain-containing protein [Saprospiraceae bacterium]|nr:DUF2281 domain-containing protein [Saprospiraceae bacterium]
MEESILQRHIFNLPPELRKEVYDFIDFLKLKHLKQKPLKQREFGYAKGKVKIAPDFDAPLDEFKEYM